MASSGGKAGLELIQKMVSQLVNRCKFDKFAMSKVRITCAEKGKVVAEMKVDDEHTNILGKLHGAMSMYLIEQLSTLTLATCPEVKTWGIGLNLHVTFIKAADLGQEIEIISKVDKAGGKIAFLSVDILDKHTRELIATGSQTKLTGINLPPLDIPR